MLPKIAVIIPVYNGRDYLPDCLNSLKEQTLSPAQIIVVDNASIDGSQELLAKFKIQNSKLKIIRNNANFGFAKACNQGIEEAIKNGADYVFLLNQDTVCERDCLEKLLSAMENSSSNSREFGNEKLEQKKQIFAIQPLILLWNNKNLVQTSGCRIHFLGFGYSGDYKKNPESLILNLKSKEIPYSSGAAMFINVKILEEVGFFDEDFFLYHEDLDLCLRARFLNYQIVLAPQTIVYHKYIERILRHRWYWSERNRQLTLLKFYKWPTLILIFPCWLLMECGVLFYSLMTGWLDLKIKSYFSVLIQLPKTLIKRRRIQKNRKISDRQMSKFLEAKFNFAGVEHPFIKFIANPIFSNYWKILKRIIFW
ncbi:MAG: glycosyltransferase family 2 protein [Patescibacteria group bacterium]